ncbi:MAG: fibronectin type III domain-containing protein [Bacteroidetes bacterium]|nr:fibronectin type III domain-containing protein [Bacteroidota bacterium]
MKKIYLLLGLCILIAAFENTTQAQSVLDPNDPVIDYDSLNPPVQPPWGQIGKWVRTKSLSWNSDSYKAYIYEGSCFRLKFPKTYNPTANDGKKYPIAVVFHGGGEAGPITDNETQLYHGGYNYMLADDNGVFDGYILFMQSQGWWGTTSYLRILDIINYMIANNKLDPFRMSVNGLSSGGQASWDMVINYPNYVTASLPMSNVSIGYKDPSVVNKVKFTPMWNFQGSLDGSPSPSTAEQVRDAMVSAGGNYRYSEYANVGHNTWDSAFADPDFFPFQLRGYSSNPWVLYGRTDFCDSNVNLTIGVPPGFDGYQWRKNGNLISGATGNTFNVTSLGTYDAKVLRGSTWSDWSHIPVVIQITPPTITPPITVSGLMSNVITSGDGKNYVNLQLPDNGYTSYTWKKVGSDSVIGTQRIYTATQPGQYIAAVTEEYGCSNVYSTPFSVINAIGKNVPDPASKLTATAVSSTEVLLNWENNPHPLYNETYFEIYRSEGQDGNYSFAGKAPADTLSFRDTKLKPGVIYFYKIRAVNNNGAAAMSNVASINTIADNILPTAPGTLTIGYTTNTSMQLLWKKSTDNVGIRNYLVFMNGVQSYNTTDTSIIINGLTQGSMYSFYVKSVDSSGNYSPQSNMVSAPAILKGLQYKYYEGYWLSVPNFNTLNPIKTGVEPNTYLLPARRQAQFAFLWQGYLRVPISGKYRISVTSDDGSMVWLNPYDPSVTPFINNDHISTVKSKYAGATLTAGLIPISIAYFQNKNGRFIQLNWANYDLYGDSAYHPIADSFFVPDYIPADTAPKAPAGLVATALSSNTIKLTWTDKSSNETGFQIYRSYKQNGGYEIIYTTNSNVVQFLDSNLTQNTKYYYKINAVNNFGNSVYTSSVMGKTQNVPNVKAPTGVKAVAQSSSSIQLTWNDVDTNETNYEIYRSAVDSSNFKLAATLPSNSNSFIDNGLYGNTKYYYKVKAVNNIKSSPDKPAVSATTKNNQPVINDKFSLKSVPAGVHTLLNLSATDPDNDTLTFSATGLPSFATLTNTGYNVATIDFNPSSSNLGNYNNIKIKVKDGKGGTDSSIFSLTVNNNYYPVLDSIADDTINEGNDLIIPLTATDQNSGDNLSFSITGAPNDFTIEPVSNGVANLKLSPNYGASGNYEVNVSVSDGNGGATTRTFNVTVNDVDPTQTIFARFKDVDNMGQPWNDITSVTTTNFKDNLNNQTSVGLSLQTTWFGVDNEGPSTGNNSGIYPDPVLKDYYYFGRNGGPETVSGNITGLDTSKTYNISFYAGSNWAGAYDNGSTVFTINSNSISLPVQNNTSKTADFINIKPASNGTIGFTMSKGSNTPAGYLNAIVIKSVYTDNIKPLAPTFLVATDAPGKGVQLNWNDNAYNETNYKVYRAGNPAGPYGLINGKLGANTTSYLDTTAIGNKQYYYFVRDSNKSGLSDSSNIAALFTKNRAPYVSPISSIIIKNNQVQNVNVVAIDDANDHLTLMPSNLPSFVTFTDNGDGTGYFTISPTIGTIGTFEDVTVTATDNNDSSSSASFNITVTDQSMNSIYVNFSNGSIAPAPWNNFTSWPTTNASLSNLLDDNGATTPVSVKIMNGFQGNFGNGMQPGNNRGAYSEIVMKTGIYEGASKTDSIQLSGLTINMKYNFVFFNSHDDGLKGTTNFTINGQTVSLNATHNINTTAAINGIVPDANGKVMIKVAKAAGADYAYLNSLIIQSYDSTQKLLAPADLRVVNITKNNIKLQWADRSFDETGFEIWRASDTTNPSYTLLATTVPNATTFIDSGLQASHTYYYTVRAIQGSTTSAYCSPVSATTYSQALYINFTFVNGANVPWNNTLALPEPGIAWNNLLDDNGVTSGIGLTETGLFAGIYGPGMNTGSNSGIYPDKVLADNYGLFPGESTTMVLNGLNLNMKYDLTFFASANIGGDVSTAYSADGKRVVLNASYNTDGTVTMYNVVPNQNGQIVITISPNTNSSQYGLIGAFVVQEANPASDQIPSPPSMMHQPLASVKKYEKLKNKSQVIANNQIHVYPNPFKNDFTISFYPEKDDNVTVELFDVNGKSVIQKNLGKVTKGNNSIRVILNQNITAGVYLLRLTYLKEGKSEYIKLIRQ